MKPATDKKDFESVNAREWDEDSSIADPSEDPAQGSSLSTVPTSAPTLAGQPARLPPSAAAVLRARPSSSASNIRNGVGRVVQPQPAAPSSAKFYARKPALVKSSPWADPPELEKTRQKKDREMRAEHKRREEKYLGQPEAPEELPGTGLYMWPKIIDQTGESGDSSSNHPRDMFGANLEKLHLLRKVHRVYISWDSEMKCLKVLSNRGGPNAEAAITATIKGIRQAVRNANAEEHHASPLYIVVPPTGVMKSKVSVKYTKDCKSGAAFPIITGFQLSGDLLSEHEQKLWNSNLKGLQQKNFELFKHHLVDHTMRLAPLRGWMRMRVHFGHVNAINYNKKKIEGPNFTFSAFEEMMSHSRTACTFDRRMDGTLATKLMEEIVGDPDMFCPKESRVGSLKDVPGKHTMVMFLSRQDVQLRVESAIDLAPGFEESSGWDKGKHKVTQFKPGSYQLGTTYPYYNNSRNKRAEVTTIDIQKGFDWTLEIIADDSFPSMPSSLLTFIESCVSIKTKEQVDELGLSYPGIQPQKSMDLGVNAIVVRSVYEYVFTESQYVIEIAIYRSWQGNNEGCQVVGRKPEIQTSVSLYHPGWDDETASIESTTNERKWDRELKCFFEQKYQAGGLEGFLDHVRFIQKFLVKFDNDRRD